MIDRRYLNEGNRLNECFWTDVNHSMADPSRPGIASKKRIHDYFPYVIEYRDHSRQAEYEWYLKVNSTAAWTAWYQIIPSELWSPAIFFEDPEDALAFSMKFDFPLRSGPTPYGAGVIVVHEGSNRKIHALVQQRSAIESEPLTWAIYGGMSEEGESPTACAEREFLEESGYSIEVEMMSCVHVHHQADNGFHFYTYVAKVDEMFEPTHSAETAQAKWIRMGRTPKTFWKNMPQPAHSGMSSFLTDEQAARLILEHINDF
jgi:ADP-ribose pyrophosphatase YjhB (NUDIX family)